MVEVMTMKTKKTLYRIKLLLFALYAVLLFVIGFTLITWQYWALTLSCVAISYLSYIEGES